MEDKNLLNTTKEHIDNTNFQKKSLKKIDIDENIESSVELEDNSIRIIPGEAFILQNGEVKRGSFQYEKARVSYISELLDRNKSSSER